MTDELHATIQAELRRTRQRYTHGRRQLVELLVDAGRPVTIGELLESGAAAAQSSLYRNLSILEQCGIVHRLLSADETARFELAEGLTEHHHHLVCDACGSVEDIALSPPVEQALHRAIDEARSDRGFDTISHRVDLHGQCADCA